MCLIIDTNTLSQVFKESDKKHEDFKPVLEWIRDGNGKIIVGGTTFDNELFSKIQWFIRLFRLLKETGKIVEISKKQVDKQELWVKSQVSNPDFDDPHIIALAGISGCKVICTSDARSFPYIQDKNLYPKRKNPPAIYTKPRNKNLLCDNNHAKCCNPKNKLPKSVKNNIFPTKP